MFLKEVIIKNFRSLKNIIIPLSKRTILIGENNAGKTSVLDAIRISLTRYSRRSSPFDDFDYYAEDEKSNPKLSEGIEIHFRFEEEKPDQWSEELIRSLGEITQRTTLPNGEDVYCVIFKVISKYDSVSRDYIFETQFLNTVGETLPQKLQITSVQNEFLLQTPVFYLSALRDVAQSFSSRSQFWGRFIRSLNIPEEELETIQGELLKINQKIMESDPQLSELKNSLTRIQDVLTVGKDNTVSIQAVPSQTWELLAKSQVVLKGSGSELNLPLTRHGQGTQSLAVLFLFRGYMDILLRSTYAETSEPILALEEPEAHLHPQAIRAVATQLEKINCQQIITTHSPYFFQNSDPRDIRVLRKHGAETTVHFVKTSVNVKINDHPALEKMIKSKGNRFSFSNETKILTAHAPVSGQEQNALSGMFKSEDIGDQLKKFYSASQHLMDHEDLQNLSSYVQKTRGEMLFARSWFLVEGQTESVVIPFFAEVMGYSFDSLGITIIEYRNNGSAKAFVKFADSLSFPWVLLSDNDIQGKNTMSEIKKFGYTVKDNSDIVCLLPRIDFETYLAAEGFLPAFIEILGDQAPDSEDFASREKYIIEVANRIKDHKVDNAYNLISILKQRSFGPTDVPEKIKALIERCVELSNDVKYR